MKRKQKIIVVISCIALLVSVLAVNCFAWAGNGDVRYYNPLSSVQVNFRSSEVLDAVSRYSETVSNYNVVIPFNGDVPRFDTARTNYNEIEVQLGDSPNEWGVGMSLDTTYSPSNSTVSCKNYLTFSRLSHHPTGNVFAVSRPEAIGAHFRYDSFILGEDMTSYVKDSYTLRGFRDLNHDGGYSVSVYAVVIVPVVFVDNHNGENSYDFKNVRVEVNASGAIGANHEVFASSMSEVIYSFSGGQSIEKNGHPILGSSFVSVFDEYLSSLHVEEYYVMDGNAYCEYADVFIDDAFDGIAVQSYAEPTSDVSSELQLPVELTIEEVIQVVEEVKVEPYNWIIQAIDGVLDTELFGTLTIGHLLLCAIAIPALLAILRAIAGG